MKITLISAAITLAMGLSVSPLQAQLDTGHGGSDAAAQSTQERDASGALLRPERMEENMDRDHMDMDADDFDAEEFVETASAKGLAEIEISNMALRDGSPSLHEFANRMITHHKAANVKLREIARSENLEMADDTTLMDSAKAMILDLRDDSFDAAYIDNQVSAHEEAIEWYRLAAQADNAQIRAYAQQQLPTLQEHLRMAQQLKAQHNSSDQ